MKTILVPTDLSLSTQYALDVAVSLARTYQAEIILLHTVLYELVPQAAAEYSPELSVAFAENYQVARNEAGAALRKLATNPRYAGVSIKTKLGSNLDGLIQCITEQPADLIIVASKGASGLMEWLEGSHAELIVRYANCPVLVIKQPIAYFQPKHIICAIDMNDQLREPHPYPFLLTDERMRQFVYVLTPSDSREPAGIREWMADYALAKGIDQYTLDIWHDKTVPAGIIHYSDDVKADLIVLYTHGYKGLRHWIEGSVAEDVLNHANQPVLIMRA